MTPANEYADPIAQIERERTIARQTGIQNSRLTLENGRLWRERNDAVSEAKRIKIEFDRLAYRLKHMTEDSHL